MRFPVLATLVVAGLGIASCRSAPEPPPSPDPASLRHTPSGDVVGFRGSYGSHVWLGIPYAQPPVGPLRWRAPRPNDVWTGTREALAFGNWCPQLASPFAGYDAASPGTPVGDEDCLTLNVYAPVFAPDSVPRGDSALPVMVWIHGGGNVVGSAAFYDGGRLAASRDVVVVTLNYRLGPLGWFRHAALRRSGTAEDHSGNYGTLDLVRGLEWVRDHVAAFGGDPGNVTIFGESAGGRDVFTLLVSPRARGLFQRAIVQSGGTQTLPLEKAEESHRNSSREVLLRLLAADSDAGPDAAKARLDGMQPEEIEATLRGRSAYELLAAYATEGDEGLIDVPQLFRDGLVLPAEDPMQVLARGDYNAVPTVFGTNRDENKLFLYANPRYVQQVLWVYPRLRNPDGFYAAAQHLSELWKATGADQPAAVLTRRQGDSVFVYRFDWDEEASILGAPMGDLIGAAHGFEIPFVFGHWYLGKRAAVLFDDENRPGREALSQEMTSYWTQFARTGDPGRGRDGKLPRWEPFGATRPEEGRFVVLDTQADGGIRMTTGGTTESAAVAGVDTDARLPTQRDKCEVYRALAIWGRGFTREQYASAGSAGCRDFPFDGYPWGG